MPRKPLKKPNGARSKSGRGRGILTASGKESAQIEVEVAVGVIERVTTTIGVLSEPRDLLRGAGSHLIGMTTVRLHVVILSIHTSLANETVNDTKAAVGHPRPDDRTVDLSPVRGRLLDGIDMTRKEPDGAAIVQAGHQHRYAKAVGEIGDIQFPTVVVIELEPTHVQTRLAHDPPEDPERGELPLCPPVRRLRQHYETASTGTDQCHRHQPLDLVLVLVH